MKYKTICAIVVNDNGDILLTKRNREPFSGKWALFSGIGESKKGFTPEEGVAEEVRCDLGTNSFTGKRIFSVPIEDDPVTDDTVVFVGSINENEVSPDPVFSQGIKWVPITNSNEFEDMAFEHTKIINKYLETLQK